jgi:hypothetical protein
VYDCPHAAATTWLRSGLPLGETARRLGHSVETLVSTYVGALENEEAVGNTKIDLFLSGESDDCCRKLPVACEVEADGVGDLVTRRSSFGRH